MIKQYFLLAYRQFRNNKLYCSLIAGALITGFTSFVLLASFYLFEKSFDRFHPELSQLYRINFELYKEGKLNIVNATSCAPVGPLLYQESDHVKAFTRLYHRTEGVHVNTSSEDKWFPQNALFHADSGVMKVFNLNLIEGQSESVLRKPFTAIISKAAAKKYFGTDSPVGQQLVMSEEESYVIEGIFEDLPRNSHLDLEILLSFSTLELLDWSKEGIRADWSWYSFYNYVLLDSEHSVDELNAQIDALTIPHTKPIDERINGALRYKLYPASEIYLHSDLLGEMEKKGSSTAVQVVAAVALLILLMSIVNYVNFMSSWMLNRVQGNSIRLILGNDRRSIFKQFFTEIALHLLVTGAISLLLVYFIRSPFNSLFGRDIPASVIYNPWFLLVYFGSIVAVSTGLSGYYTMTTKTSSPGTLLKGNFKTSIKGILLRRGIVTFQFFCALSMIIGTLAMSDQIQFMMSRPKGFESDNMLFMKIRRTRGDEQFYQNLESVQRRLDNIPWITQSTISTLVPGQSVGWTSGGKLRGQETTVKIHNYGIDEFFIPSMSIEMAGGESFTSNEAVARQSVLINEEAMNAFGYTKPSDVLNAIFLLNGDEARPFEIIGVVKDFHQRGLQYKIEPTIFHYLPGNPIYSGPAYVTLKFNDERDLASRLSEVEEIFQDVYPGRTLESDLVNDFYYRQYETEKNTVRTLGLFSILTIVISSLGIIGLISFAVLQRAKEIGVRKILGASVVQIQILMAKEFIYMIILATAIAFPVCYYLLNQWLSGFEYKIDVTATPFVVGSVSTLIFSAGLICMYVYRYAMINPVKSLKSE